MADDDRRRFLANANADAARLSRLVGRLMELARADMATARRSGPIELATPIRTIADALSRPHLTVRAKIEDGLKAAIPSEALEAILTTLAENAAQAGATRIDLSAYAENGGAVIEVSDDGPGVSLRDRERLFEPFFTTRRGDGGAGLGLAIARSLLAAHQGSIGLAPSASGATFRIWLRT